MKSNIRSTHRSMQIAKAGLASGFLIFTMAGTAVSQDAHPGVVNAATMQWAPAPPFLPKGAEIAVLVGDPGKAAPFTIRLKLPAGYKLAAHSHPTFEAVTVISGAMNVGMGDKLDESSSQKLGLGDFINLPEQMNHFAFFGEGSVIQINSMGPFAIDYVNPADDPRKAL